MNPLIQLRKSIALSFVVLLLACFGFLSAAQAVVPAPDGGYPGGNSAEGQNALLSLTTGGFNTAVGFLSLRSNTTNSFNTAIGAGTLLANTANENTATGAGALFSNTSGGVNTANGAFALFSNTTGSDNTAIGKGALQSNTTGSHNTATGLNALIGNSTGFHNTAVGDGALFSNTVGHDNVASGYLPLAGSTIGNGNTAIGSVALGGNTVDSANTAIGNGALSSTTACCNTAVGGGALLSNTTGVNNLALGYEAGLNVTTASDTICIGHLGLNVDGSTWISNVYGVTTQSGTTAPVIVSDQGQLGTVVSSQRFKKDIATMEKASEAILSLRPVTFHYKTDAKSIPQFGLIAEEVAKVNPALVLPDKEGKPYSVRYDAVNAMLLNEFLKEHRKVEQLTKDFESKLAEQQKQIATLAAGLQKVSAQLEMNKSAPQTVLNDQ